ncbi:MAG: hypothetical protein MUP02_10290, partial [Actinobacteria bacterium]|nr:hypothetical protein [Actinomycetota bacterium]
VHLHKYNNNLPYYFDYMECINDFDLEKTKLVNKILKIYSFPEAFLVDDRIEDMKAAKNNNICFIHASYGYGEDISLDSTIKLKDFSGLLKYDPNIFLLNSY